MENNILGMYELVFEDCVRNYLEDMEDKVELTESEIKEIADKIIYKNEYVWEVINETINEYIGNMLLER